MSQHADGQATDMPGSTRVTVEEAAKLLGLSGNAVRKRLERGTLKSEKIDGIRYIILDTDMLQHANDTPPDTPGDIALMQEHLDSMREQIAYLKDVIAKRDEEIRRRDHLLAAALERIPAIEPPPDTSAEPRESPVSSSEAKADTHIPPEEKGPISWWRRIFGVPRDFHHPQ
jgi:excisionase family DNA binding protein